MKGTTFLTSFRIPRELRLEIDELRARRARSTLNTPPTMADIIVEAIQRYLSDGRVPRERRRRSAASNRARRAA